ncbi:hypothetical protein DM01DRAFT_1411061 [Hesseltinella vesiculosa]|uniref:Uncharacterized protein n=1 Tax=Hesseltinella vesiculosa TaxID=101127 RepID=A0A1X2G545_9FUNG|nr:hypothetical protein DM01DRAFT_1411061 [Hesseltinella vesiculosa]
MDQLRFVSGDWQDLLMFLKTTNKNVRLVVLDYRGLSTVPRDVFWFVKKHKQILEICVDEGHHIAKS